MVDVRHFGIFNIASGELIAVASGTFDNVLSHYENAEVTIVEGEFDPTWRLIGGNAVQQTGPSLTWYKQHLRNAIRQARLAARSGTFDSSFGETILDLPLMGIAPRLGPVQWRFTNGPAALNQNQWRQFLDEVWEFLTDTDDEETVRLDLVEAAVNQAQLQTLIDLLLPEN